MAIAAWQWLRRHHCPLPGRRCQKTSIGITAACDWAENAQTLDPQKTPLPMAGQHVPIYSSADSAGHSLWWQTPYEVGESCLQRASASFAAHGWAATGALEGAAAGEGGSRGGDSRQGARGAPRHHQLDVVRRDRALHHTGRHVKLALQLDHQRGLLLQLQAAQHASACSFAQTTQPGWGWSACSRCQPRLKGSAAWSPVRSSPPAACVSAIIRKAAVASPCWKAIREAGQHSVHVTGHLTHPLG